MSEKMDKKERGRILSQDNKILYARAVRDLIIEKMVTLSDITLSEDLDDYRAKKEAKKILKEIFRSLAITEADVKEKTKSQYE